MSDKSPERIIELFVYCVSRLRLNDHGLASGHDIGDLNACALLCASVKAITNVPDTVEDILLFDWADATQALLVTAVAAPDGDVVGRYLKCKAAVAQNRLSAI